MLGVDLRLDDWHDTEPKDFYWIREPFHKGVNNTGKTIIFGHTPLRGLNEDGDFMKLWQHDGKIGSRWRSCFWRRASRYRMA